METQHLRSRLAEYFVGRSSEHPVVSPGPLTVLKGGRAGSLHTFSAGPPVGRDEQATTLVLKLYAPDAAGRRQAAREGRALSTLGSVDYPVPGVVAVEPDPHHLGYPFVVMEHIPGVPFWDAYDTGELSTRSRLTARFAARLVELHSLDPGVLDPHTRTIPPDEHLERELAQLRLDGAAAPHPRPADVVRWLERRRHAVPCDRAVIQHRDYHAWNVLVGPSERLWVIDWDWQIGDARFDLAWIRTLMQRSGHDAFSDAVRDEYAARSRHPLDGLEYFEVLTTLRWLLNVVSGVESNVLLDPEARADFRAFLVKPVERARELLQERTGIDVDITMAVSP